MTVDPQAVLAGLDAGVEGLEVAANGRDAEVADAEADGRARAVNAPHAGLDDGRGLGGHTLLIGALTRRPIRTFPQLAPYGQMTARPSSDPSRIRS